MSNHIEFESRQKNKPEAKAELDVKDFFDTASLYGVNGYVWLVNWDLALATHCSDETHRQGWEHIYAPTNEWFLMFLKDEDHFEGRRRYPPYR